MLGIVGESGSGKTTLLKSISARLTPQQGGNSLREPFAVCNERGRPPSPAAYRMGRGASASTRRPAPPGVGGRQYRRAADGDRGHVITAIFVPPRRSGWKRWRFPPTGSTTCRPPFPAVCSSVCRLPATW
ncbi:ATP-binding cassette domain-containing protein [Escherichia coli]|nr:ATP-binding cassette domain-containing protein [Escherichia coli]